LSREITLGLIQMDCRLNDLEYNKNKAVRMITDAAAKGANMVCLPELFSSGYNPNAVGWKWHYFAEDGQGRTVQELSRLAQQLKISIIAPMAEKRELPGVIYNSAFFIYEDGQVLGSYAKTHLWYTEKNYFRQGDSLRIFETSFGKIGLLICYDILFPELIRQLTLAGAELIFLPSAWRAVEDFIWNTILPARALENTVFLAAVNRIGTDEEIDFFGESCVLDPQGKFLEQGKRNEEDIIIKTINLDELSRFRYDFPYLRDLQPELYKRISKRIISVNAEHKIKSPFPSKTEGEKEE